MSANELAAVVLGGAGLVSLVWLTVADAVSKRRAFTALASGVVASGVVESGVVESESAASERDSRYMPDPRYFVGLLCVISALGFAGSVQGGAILGALGAVVLALAFRRSGVRVTSTEVVLGSGREPARIPLSGIGAVVARPRGVLGPSYGVFGIADRSGRWLGAVRYATVVNGPRAAVEIIAAAELVESRKGVWLADEASVPSGPLPFAGI